MFVRNDVELLLDFARTFVWSAEPSTPPSAPSATRFAIALHANATSSISPLRSPLALGVTTPLLDEELDERRVISEHCLHLV